MSTISIQAKDLLKKDGIITCSSDATLSQALSQLNRSHDACFVLDSQKNFLGLISPYFTIFKSKYPPETKVTHCLFNPPRISSDTVLWDISKQMVEAKIYFLPVLKGNKIQGIVTLNRIFSLLLQNKNLANSLPLVWHKDIITLDSSASTEEAYTLMRDQQVSRLPIIDKEGKLTAIITRYDIQLALTAPKTKTRFSSRSGEKTNQLDSSIMKFAKRFVFTLSEKTQPFRIIEIMKQNSIGSVVLLNPDKKPAGIITSYDILKAISIMKPQKNKNISISADRSFLEYAQLEQMVASFYKKIAHQKAVQSIQVTVQTHKNPAGIIRSYSISLSVTMLQGKIYRSTLSDFSWKKALYKSMDKIESQLRD